MTSSEPSSRVEGPIARVVQLYPAAIRLVAGPARTKGGAYGAE